MTRTGLADTTALMLCHNCLIMEKVECVFANGHPGKHGSAEDDEVDEYQLAKLIRLDKDSNVPESPEPAVGKKQLLPPLSHSTQDEVDADSSFKQEEESCEADRRGSIGSDENNSMSEGASQKLDKLPPSEEDIAKMLNVPTDIIKLRRVDTTFDGKEAIGWIACSALPLPKGCSIGSYQGCEISESQIKMGQLILMFHEEDKRRVLMNVTQSTGAWLALLRRPVDIEQKNANVYLENGRIWCEIIKDIDIGTEIIGTFSIEQESAAGSKALKKAEAKVIVETPSNENSEEKTTHAALIYGCPFCGVRFSSPRTLEAHIMIYCSKKPSELVFKTVDGTCVGESGSCVKNIAGARNKCPSPKVDKVRVSTGQKVSVEEHSVQIKRENMTQSPDSKIRNSPCPVGVSSIEQSCSLKRNSSTDNEYEIKPAKSSNTILKTDIYCKECNIQFSSSSTYNGHKEYYCPKRERVIIHGGGTVPGKFHCDNCDIIFTSESTYRGHKELYCPELKSVIRHHHSPKQSPKNNKNGTNEKRNLVSVSSDQTARILPGQTAFIFTSSVIGSNGIANVAFNMPTVICQPLITTSASVSPIAKRDSHKPSQHVNNRTDESDEDEESPLDLRTNKTNSLGVVSANTQSGAKTDKDDSVQKIAIRSPIKTEDVVNACIRSDGDTSLQSEQCALPTIGSVSSTYSGLVLDNKVGSSMNLFPLHVYPPLLNVQRILTPQLNVSPTSNVSKCTDCNIVFYKRANFLAHKEHYCSGKKLDDSSESDDGYHNCDRPEPEPNNSEPHSPKINTSPPSNERDKVKMISQQSQIFRYYCRSCQIKFSSASNLKAHKEFYCPSDKAGMSTESDVEHATDDEQEHENEDSKSDHGIFYTCERCGGKLSSSRLVKVHLCYCRGPCTRNKLVKCRYCDFVTQTEAKLSDHVKLHVPSKSYRCSLCGYRGNTLRGMRMHGKVHQDEGVSFSDDNVIAFEEPPLIPIQSTNHLTNAGQVDAEAELIRLKNEPYKRRRSRKTAEQISDSVGPPVSPSTILQRCHHCGEAFDDMTKFFTHLQMHGLVSMTAFNARQQCKVCDYKPSTLHDLIQHIHSCHKQSDNQLTPDEKEESNNNPADTRMSTNSPDSNVHGITIKQEPIDNFKEPVLYSDSLEQNTEETKPAIKYESDDEGAYIEPSPKVQNDEHTESEDTKRDIDNLSETESNEKTDITTSKDQSVVPSVCNSISEMTHSTPKLGSFPPYGLPLSNPLMAQYMALQTFSNVISPSAQTTYESRGPRYCRHCDISFNYLSSFLAHKKYYCSARAPEDLDSSTRA